LDLQLKLGKLRNLITTINYELQHCVSEQLPTMKSFKVQ